MIMETQGAARLLNPCLFHLEKLGLELKCPLCLNMLNTPMLLPCNHIFCNRCVPKSHQFTNECPTCQHHFTDQEFRPASFMENILAIYRSLKATFNSNVLPLLSADSGTSVSRSTSIEQLRKNLVETEDKSGNNCVEGQIQLIEKTGNFEVLKNDQSHEHERQMECVVASKVDDPMCGLDLCPSKENVNGSPLVLELDANQGPESSPGSSPSFVDAGTGHNSAQGCKDGSVKTSSLDHKNYPVDISHVREPKRQKKLNYGSNEPVMHSHGGSQQKVSRSDESAISNSNEDHRSKNKTSIVSSTALCEASDVNGSACAFCHSALITEDTGPMIYYANGKEVTSSKTAFPKAIPVHRACIDWSPRIYYDDKDTIKNLESELARASKLKCCKCGLKGAALGCFQKSCRRTYHVPCALQITGCRWDCENYLMLCPVHKSIKFQNEKFDSGNQDFEENHPLTIQKASELLSFWSTSHNGLQEWVFCGSALSSEEKCLMVKFAKICGATVYKFWNPSVTHVIAATDENGACSRTLKVLMAILNGRWVLTIDWVRACVEANCPVNEEPYEVNLDNHGFRDGPKTGRLRASNNAPKLFDGLSFHFNGDFVPAYKNDLLDLVAAGGGAIIEKTDQMVSTSFVVYNHDHPRPCTTEEGNTLILKRLSDAESVAKSINAQVIPHTWILESIASCKMLPQPLC